MCLLLTFKLNNFTIVNLLREYGEDINRKLCFHETEENIIEYLLRIYGENINNKSYFHETEENII